jgi:hypothetical protein
MGEAPHAPHQASALRRVSVDGHDLATRSPRASQDLSSKELQLLHDQQSDEDDQDVAEIEQELADRRSGDGQDVDADGEDDESLDDDMMDKISSSPSIDDGGYLLPPVRPWPKRGDSLTGSMQSTPESTRSNREDATDLLSSSPYESTPTHMPLAFLQKEKVKASAKHHHVPGEYPEDPTEDDQPKEPELPSPPKVIPRLPLPVNPLLHEDSMELRDKLTPMFSEKLGKEKLNSYREKSVGDRYDDDFDASFTDLEDLLVPEDDPLLDDSFDSGADVTGPDTGTGYQSSDFSDSDDGYQPAETYDENDDDVDDFFFEDTRFVDSGWGGECLRDVEDIDFEFVYALHTFVATVEGQANATKGDTMVLLDDSNSYWWLVRVVKDSSIGR